MTPKTLYSLSAALCVTACATVPPTTPLPEIPDTPTPTPQPDTPSQLPRAGLSGQPLLQRADVQAFLREMVAQHSFSAAGLQNLFRQVRLKPDIVAAMTRPSEAKPWHAYRPQFLTEKRIAGGAAFWRMNAQTLARAEQQYGVPPEVVVAIIGVETEYGGNMGKFRVLDAVTTLAFEYPRRAEFFRKELENFLLMTREERLDPLNVRGSYAGAMGYGQFMPSSFRKYAVDFDGDGRRDLWKSAPDAIGSVAHYFQQHGWRSGQPVAIPALISGSDFATALVNRELVPPQRSIIDFKAQGVLPKTPVPDAQSALLLELKGRDGPEYWLAFDNFYTITRYNRSVLYGMAVYQLSAAIRARFSNP